MKMRICLSALLAAAVGVAPPITVAAEPGIQVKQVQFKKGSSGSTIKASIKGEQTIDYKLRTGAGQVLTVSFKPSNPSTYFNVLPPGSQGEAIHIGSSAGNEFKLDSTEAGEYSVRVYLMRNAARRNEHSNYQLKIDVTGSPSK